MEDVRTGGERTLLIAIISSAVAVLLAILGLFGSMIWLTEGVREDLRGVESRVTARINNIDERLQFIEVEFGKVEQRLDTFQAVWVETIGFETETPAP